MSAEVGWGWGEIAPGGELLFYQRELNPFPQGGGNAANSYPLVLSLSLCFPLSLSLFFINTHTHTHTPSPTLPLPPKCNGAGVKCETRIAPLASFLSGLYVCCRLLKLKLWDSSSAFHRDGQFTKYSLGFRGLPLLSLWVSP